MEIRDILSLAAAGFSTIAAITGLITKAQVSQLKAEFIGELRESEKHFNEQFVRRDEFVALHNRMERRR